MLYMYMYLHSFISFVISEYSLFNCYKSSTCITEENIRCSCYTYIVVLECNLQLH